MFVRYIGDYLYLHHWVVLLKRGTPRKKSKQCASVTFFTENMQESLKRSIKVHEFSAN